VRGPLALMLLAITGPVLAQQAGDTLVLVGWMHVHTANSQLALHTELRPSAAGSVLGISNSFDSPGTSVSVRDVNTLGISFARFLTNHISVTLNAGIPPIVNVSGAGVVQPTGPAGPLFAVNLGDPKFNPIASARQWSPALALQYHFGTSASRVRPFLGAGVTYTWFTGVRLNPTFEEELNNRVGQPLALAAGKPGPTSASVGADSVWEPVFVAGLPFALNEHWGITLSAAYVPFNTDSTVRIYASDGTLLATSRPHIAIDALVSGLLLSYKF
jgi:outer membrane protein